MIKKESLNIAEFMNGKDYEKVNVILHLHFDNDEEFDYTGMHSIAIDVWMNKEPNKQQVVKCYGIDLEGYNVEDCRKEHEKILTMMKDNYSNIIEREMTHN